MEPMHRKLVEIFEKKKIGKLLDAGAGDGKLSSALADLGHIVHSCDIDEKVFKAKTKFTQANLNKNFPYKDKQFDYVLLTEVIEHLENPNHAIRECSRILKDGGLFVTTTPNITSIFSRIKFLITGEFFCFSKAERDSKFGHINAVPYWEIEDIFRRVGFKLIDVRTNHYLDIPGSGIKKIVSKIAYVVLYPLLRPKNKEILKGDNLIFVAKKVK
ncbi:MAG: class I SAM-dependent methyltransferase [Candidatus Aenigmatarchaeota archaeon]